MINTLVSIHWISSKTARDHANVLILQPSKNEQSNETKTTSIEWKDIFLCVPYDCTNNDYSFTFINSLHPTTFYAMLYPNTQTKWHPIWDTFDELKRNVDTSSNQIKINLEDEEIKILSLYFTLTVPNFNYNHNYSYNNKNSAALKIRLPSVIQKIPVFNTRQYWEKIVGYDSSIIRYACQIPTEITNHLESLQNNFLKDRQSMLELKESGIYMIVNNAYDGKFDSMSAFDNDYSCKRSVLQGALIVKNKRAKCNVDYSGDDYNYNSMVKGSFKS